MKFNFARAAALGLVVALAPADRTPAADPVVPKGKLTFPVVGKPGAAADAASVSCRVDRNAVAPVTSVAFRPDGKMLAAAGYGEVLLWDLAAGKLANRIGTDQVGDSVGAVLFLPDGKSLAVGGGTPASGGVLKLFSVESGDAAATLEGPKDVVDCLALSPDGKRLAAGSADGNAYVYNLADKKLLETIDQHNGWILDVTFSLDGTMLATASTDRAAKVWKVEDFSLMQTLEQDEAVNAVAFASDNKQLALAYGGSTGWGVQIRRVDNARSKRSVYYRGGMPLDAAWLKQGNNLLIGLSDGTVQSLQNLRPKTTFTEHGDWVYALAVSPDAKTLATGSGDGTVKLWSMADGRLLATLVQVAPRSGEWLAITPQGYFSTSAADSLEWQTANVETPANNLPGLLGQPESVAQVLSGEEVAAPKVK